MMMISNKITNNTSNTTKLAEQMHIAISPNSLLPLKRILSFFSPKQVIGGCWVFLYASDLLTYYL